MDDGKVLYGSHDGVQVLRFLGHITYTLAPSVSRFLDNLFSGAPLTGFVIDLKEALSLDSTSLGLLARIANRMRERGGRRVTIISNQEDINEVLLNMGFDHVFDIVGDCATPIAEAQPLPIERADQGILSRTVLEAHRTLMALNERNRNQFADVVNLLEQQGADGRPHTR